MPKKPVRKPPPLPPAPSFASCIATLNFGGLINDQETATITRRLLEMTRKLRERKR